MFKRSDNLKTLFLVFSIVLFISLMPFVSSLSDVPQNYQQLTAGMELKIPQDNVLKVGEDYEFYIHAFYIATGNPADGKTTCDFWLYNSSGNLIYNKTLLYIISGGGYNFHLLIQGGNFSSVGELYYNIDCQDDTIGGFASSILYVTSTGEILTPAESILYFLVTLFAFGIFFLITWIFLNINGENPKDETGYLGINYRKYIKTALFPLVYVSFLWFFNFIIGLSNNYLGLTLYSNTLEFIFMILTKLVFPVIVVTLLIEIVLMVKDGNIEKEYKSLWSRF
jgi:hypothetical protein